MTTSTARSLAYILSILPDLFSTGGGGDAPLTATMQADVAINTAVLASLLAFSSLLTHLSTGIGQEEADPTESALLVC